MTLGLCRQRSCAARSRADARGRQFKRCAIFKWIGIVLAALLTIAIIFHRPIFFRLTRYFVVRAAEQQNLSIDYNMSGSIFAGLQITDLRATPTEPGPVERLEVGSLRLEYSLWGLLREGLPGFLDRVAIADVVAVIDPAKQLTPEKAQKDQSFKFPALIPEELSIENLNFTSRAAGDDLVIADFDLLLHPRREGFLRAQTIQVPGVQTWTNLNATASYANRDLILDNFDLGPAMQFRRINLDLSKLSADVIAFGLDATLFGGVTTLSGKITDLHETSALTLTAENRNNSLAQASNYFNLEPSLGGTLEELTLVLTGAITKPVTWSGRATLRVEDFTRAQIAQPTDARLLVELSDGKAVVKSMELLQGENKISATARVDLPKTLDGFAQLNATGTLAADLNNVASVSNKAAEGSLAAQGNFAVKNGNPTADLHLSTDHLTLTNGEVSDATGTMHLEKEFGQKGGPFWQGLETKISGKAEKLRFKNYAVDSAEFDVTTEGERVKINNLEAVRADNDVQLSGEFALPNDLAEFDQKQVDFELKVNATDLKQLIVDQTGTALTGNLSLTGEVARKSGTMNGSLSLAGSDVQYGGLRIPQISGAIDVSDNVVKIERLRVALPDEGAIAASGTYDLNAPHAYRGELHAESDTLENFEPLLRSFGSQAELGGSLKLDWRGSGTVRPQSHFGAATMVLRDGRYNDFRELGADVSGMYSPELVQVPTIQLRSEMANATADVELRDQTLRVNSLRVQQGRRGSVARRSGHSGRSHEDQRAG